MSNFCTLQGHQKQEITRICIFDECLQASRLICEDCVKEELHSHGYKLFSYLMQIDKFNTDLKDLRYLKKMTLQRQLQWIESIKKELNQMAQTIQKILVYQDIYQQYKENDHLISRVDKDQINSLVKIDVALKDYSNFSDHIKSLQIQIQNKEQTNIQYQMPLKLNQIFSNKKFVTAPIISENEKVLVTNSLFMKQSYTLLKIVSLPRQKVVYRSSITTDFPLFCLSSDSNLLIIYSYKEKQIHLFKLKNFKLISRMNVRPYQIEQVLWIKNNRILVYNPFDHIIIFDIAQRSRNIQTHATSIAQLQYDHSNDLMVGYQQNKIMFFDYKNGQVIFQHQMEHKIQQSQITNMGQNILVNSNNILWIFKIDHQLKSLKQIKYVKIQKSFQFLAVNDFKKIIIIKENKILEVHYDLHFYNIYELQSPMCYNFKIYQSPPNISKSNYILLQHQVGEGHTILKNDLPYN